MKINMFLGISMAAIAVAASAPANASQLLFDFSGPSGTASFQLESNPTPDFTNTVLPGSDQFGFNDVAGTYNGTPGTASTISFGQGILASLNIVAPGLGFTQFSSPTLFTGSVNAPTFSAGTYTLVNPFLGNGTLSISQVAGAVPEPGTWALMILGFGFIGGAARYRRHRATVSFA